MSLIKKGICEKCNNEFYWSIGHPPWWEKAKWALDFDEIPEAKWWFGMGNVCASCTPPPESIDGSISDVQLIQETI